MGSHVRVAVAQINCTVGDFDGNSRRILDMAARASSAGARVLLTPELSLSGYPPEDLLLRRVFYEASDATLAQLAGKLLQFPELHVIVGHPLAREGQRYNAASLLAGGMVRGTYCKHDLPNYDVFDEQRYFTPDNRPLVFEVAGTRFGINICEDTWFRYAPEAARAAGAQVLLIPNGSAVSPGQTNTARGGDARERYPLRPVAGVREHGRRQDELVFDGASFALDAHGQMTHLAPQFDEYLLPVDFIDGVPQPSELADLGSIETQAYGALKLGVRDYLGKNGFPGAIIGLSGGIDSALVLAVAVDALGADKVRAVMMPSQFTADISWLDARAMATKLGVRYDEILIKPPSMPS